MSFLFKSSGPSSAEKIAAVETELEMVSDMFNRHETLPSYILPRIESNAL